jgi:hypothetical protein
MALVKVKNFPDRIFAERAQQTLEAEHISSIIQSPDAGIVGAGGVSGMSYGADLYVESEHAARARELLESLFDGI